MSLFEDASLIVTPNAQKAGKLYAIKPDNGVGDLTVTRATEATRVNSAGLIETVANNVPRLDYTNGSCPSILVEPQRTNLLLRSEEFNDAYWIKTRGFVTPNQTISPSGTLTSDKFTDGVFINSFSAIERSVNLVSGTTYTQSCFFKKGNLDFVFLSYFVVGGATGISIVNINTKEITFSTNFLNTQVIELDNQWIKISITYLANGTVVFPAFGHTSNSTSPNYNGTGTNFSFIWGTQLEAGSNATSYIPTVASAVTRNADVISKTGLTGITTITETFENGTTNVISGSPTSYTMSQGRIKQVIGI
jgi:hypothetical protein